jgi:hypothetical protein
MLEFEEMEGEKYGQMIAIAPNVTKISWGSWGGWGSKE